MHEESLDLRAIYRVLRHRWRLLLALPLLAVLVAALVTFFLIKPVYSASTTLWVVQKSAGQISYNDLMLSRNLTKTYAEVAKSRAVLGKAIEKLSLQGELTAQDLQTRITVTPAKDTEILTLKVQDRDPDRAVRLADAVAESFGAAIQSYMKVENVAVIDRATPPGLPVSPRPAMNLAIALVLGAMAAVGLAFLLEFLDTTVRTTEDVAEYLGLPVVGVIPVIELKAVTVPAVRPHAGQRPRKDEMGVES
jgi:capsular polysaccharide biosynthesis protein